MSDEKNVCIIKYEWDIQINNNNNNNNNVQLNCVLLMYWNINYKAYYYY